MDRRYLMTVVPALLCIVAARQVYLVVRYDLTSWKGGGFGMFATVPWNRNRVLSLELLLDDGRTVEVSAQHVIASLPHDRSVETRLQELLALPTEERAREIARKMVAIDWRIPADQPGSGGDAPTGPPPGRSREAQFAKVAAVQVQVWEYRFRAPEGRLHRTSLQNVTEYPGGNL